MSRLVDDLLSLSRIEMTEHMRPSGQVDLCAVSAPRRRDRAVSTEMKVTIDATVPGGPV